MESRRRPTSEAPSASPGLCQIGDPVGSPIWRQVFGDGSKNDPSRGGGPGGHLTALSAFAQHPVSLDAVSLGMGASHAGPARRISKRHRPAVIWILGTAAFLAAPCARAESGLVTVSAHAVTRHFVSYARVEPIATVSVEATATGVLHDLKTVPGSAVRADRILAVLRGPEIRAALVRAATAVRSAEARVAAAKKTLQADRRQLRGHLITEAAVADATSALARARNALIAANAARAAIRDAAVLRAPVAGTVLAVRAASGERVTAGETVLTLQPKHGLWVKAFYYGPDASAIHAGMTGRFFPSGGGSPVPIKVATVFGSLAPDGGEAVGMSATVGAPDWINGEAGTVTLNGPTRFLVAVPTSALVLDQGQWWVLVQTPAGIRRRAVEPGSVHGWQTYLDRGLEPGDRIVVENAYLRFHRQIAGNYQPPD